MARYLVLFPRPPPLGAGQVKSILRPVSLPLGLPRLPHHHHHHDRSDKGGACQREMLPVRTSSRADKARPRLVLSPAVRPPPISKDVAPRTSSISSKPSSKLAASEHPPRASSVADPSPLAGPPNNAAPKLRRSRATSATVNRPRFELVPKTTYTGVRHRSLEPTATSSGKPSPVVRPAPRKESLEYSQKHHRGHENLHPSPPAKPPKQVDRLAPSANGTRDSGLIAIGLALGSPTQSPPCPDLTARPHSMTATTNREAEGERTQTSSKTSSSKKSAPSRSPVKKRDASGPRRPGRPMKPFPTTTPVRTNVGGLKLGVERDDSPTIREDTTTGKLRLVVMPPKSSKTPSEVAKPPNLDPDEEMPPKPPAKDRRPKLHRPSASVQEAIKPSLGSFLDEPYLNVEIPSVRMERYSVMFSSLLDRNPSTILLRSHPSHESKATVKEEKTHAKEAEEVGLVEEREDVAKTPTSTPPALQQSSSSTSSSTSPPQSPSSSQPKEQGSEMHAARPAAKHIAQSARKKALPDGTPPMPPPAQALHLVSKFSRRSSSPTMLSRATGDSESPSTDDGDALQARVQLRDRLEAELPIPKLESSISKPLPRPHAPRDRTDARSRPLPSTPGKKSSPQAGRQVKVRTTPPPQPRQPQAEVSMARQISLSRKQQRATLGPLQRHPLENKCIIETKTSTPLIVEPRQDPNLLQAMRCKSQTVLVESA